MIRMKCALSAAALVAAAAASAAGAPLNLVSVNPDVASIGVAVSYNATTQTFTASGRTQNLLLPSLVSVPLGNVRQFLLTAIIDNNGNLAGPGSLTVRGDYNVSDELLFSSNTISAFGFSAFNKFEFVFIQQAGSLAPVGTPIGTILVEAGLSFAGGVPDFHSSFDSAFFPGGPGTGNADTFVPAPASAGLLVGLGAMSARRRRR